MTRFRPGSPSLSRRTDLVGSPSAGSLLPRRGAAALTKSVATDSGSARTVRDMSAPHSRGVVAPATVQAPALGAIGVTVRPGRKIANCVQGVLGPPTLVRRAVPAVTRAERFAGTTPVLAPVDAPLADEIGRAH